MPADSRKPVPITPDQIAKFRAIMVDAEGLRPKVYLDTQGNLTVGIGHKVLPEDNLKLGEVIGSDRIESLFQSDAIKALGAAQDQANGIGIGQPDFIPSLASVNFQLGSNWPKTFRKTWSAMAAGDYATAAMEAARSRWMHKAPKRVRAFQDALLALPQGTEEPEN